MADQKISQLTAASTPLAGTEVLPLVQSSTTKKVAVDDLTVKNIRSNSTSGLLQLTGPAAAATRVMTTPDANFTVARTDAAQTFTGVQTFSNAGSNNISLFEGTYSGTLQQNSANLYFNTSSNSAVAGSFFWRTSNALTTVLSLSGSTGNLTANTGNFVIGTAGKGIDFSANTAAAGMTSELLTWYEEGTVTATMSPTTSGTITLAGTHNTLVYTRVGRMVTVTGMLMVDTVGSPVGAINVNLPFAAASGNSRNSAVALFVNGSNGPLSADFIGQVNAGASTMTIYLGDGTYVQSDSADAMQASTQVTISATYFA